MNKNNYSIAACLAVAISASSVHAKAVSVNSDKEVYFGNFHVHTSYSFDGYNQGAIAGPDDAYRWAKGESISLDKAGRVKAQIQGRPLDWYAVTDHAEFLGVFQRMADPNSELSKLPIAQRLNSKNRGVAWKALTDIFDCMNRGSCNPALTAPELSASLWKEVVNATEQHNDPGKFTTLVGFEWTSGPSARNMHRVVVFKGDGTLPEVPYSRFDSDKPEELWKWMDKQRASGTSLLAVPHNGNASDGLMFPETTSYGGSEINKAYSELRMRNEPLYEITQIKGTSETHPDLSPNDEFAGFEIWDYTLSLHGQNPTNRTGSYVRDAMLRGMKMESEGKGNPYKYGFIGDSDTHNSAAPFQENNNTGKFGFERSPKGRLFGVPGMTKRNILQTQQFSSGGLAAVWAGANTRDEIFDALERKETYATTGSRMRVRTFASFDYDASIMQAGDWVQRAYRLGIPMGGDLTREAAHKGKAPVILVQAMKDPDGANLDRVQIVKGWMKDGVLEEKIYDVALSDGRQPDANGKVAAVGNTVDVKTATYTNSIGDTELMTAWTDPDFDASAHAFYYARVLEIPTPRWSTIDAATLGVEPLTTVPVSIQERAFTSPIWYTP